MVNMFEKMDDPTPREAGGVEKGSMHDNVKFRGSSRSVSMQRYVLGRIIYKAFAILVGLGAVGYGLFKAFEAFITN